VTSAELHLDTAGAASPRKGRQLPGWFGWRVLIGSLVAGIILGAILVSVAWTAFGAEQMAPPRDVQLTIPSGTASLIAAGKPSGVPSQIQINQGDRLILVNQDVVKHTVGGWTVSAGSSITILAESQATNVFACTIHQGGTLAIIVNPRPGLADGILFTFLVGVPFGLVLFAAATVFRNLDLEPEAA